MVFAFLTLTPIIAILIIAYPESIEQSIAHWGNLFEYVLIPALTQTTQLLIGVGCLSLIIGLGCSYLVSHFDFPFRRLWLWGLILPLAVPTYISAFVFVDLWHPIGPIQSFIRGILGYNTPREWRFADVRGMGAAIIVFTLVLYPYVYIGSRIFFGQQSRQLIEVAKSLGLNSYKCFTQITLPLMRPGLMVAVIMVLLETLNDIGASEILGIYTLMLAVQDTWVGKNDLVGAAQIALSALIIVFALIALEWQARKRIKTTQNHRPLLRQQLSGWAGVFASIACFLPIFFGFLLPIGFLFSKIVQKFTFGSLIENINSLNLLMSIKSLYNSLFLAFWVSTFTLIGGIILAFTIRKLSHIRNPNLIMVTWRKLISLAPLGYALPGTLIALGFLVPLSYMPAGWFGIGGLGALLVVLSVRFLMLSQGHIDSVLQRISPNLDQVAISLDCNYWRVFYRIHLPLILPAAMAGFLMVFIDTIKELPATLLLRPINFETLATQIYADATRGTYEDGAFASLFLVLIGLLPVYLIARDKNISNVLISQNQETVVLQNKVNPIFSIENENKLILGSFEDAVGVNSNINKITKNTDNSAKQLYQNLSI